jgi:hypothetical protein
LNALVRLELASKPTSVEDDVRQLEELVNRVSVSGKKSKGNYMSGQKDKDVSRRENRWCGFR